MAAVGAQAAYVFPRHRLAPIQPNKQPVVLIACGSFSPPTYAHLRMLEQTRDWIRNNRPEHQVIGGFMSPVSSGYQKKGLSSTAHRQAMCHLATETSDWIAVDTWESDQANWTPTRQVLAHFDQSLNEGRTADEPRIRVQLICGADLLKSFLEPGVWLDEDLEVILGQHGLLCLERGNSRIHELIYANHILWRHERNIGIVHQFITNETSSTAVRTSVARGLSINYLTPDGVIKYIRENKLYASL